MTSGVKPDDSCIEIFKQMQLQHAYKFITFKKSDDKKSIVIDQTSTGGTWDDFCEVLPKKEGRYAVFDFEYNLTAGGLRNKLVFILWNPEEGPTTEKIWYTTSKGALRNKLPAITQEVQATDNEELDYDDILNKISKGLTN
ncbi:uncharacterized protein LOC144435322 [Glandiceps talaboti]